MAKKSWKASRKARFRTAIIYIQEAHASDTWPFGLPAASAAASTHCTEARAARAASLRAKIHADFCGGAARSADVALCECARSIEIYVDAAPLNEFNHLFAVWPMRSFCFERAAEARSVKVAFIDEPVGDAICFEKLQSFVTQNYTQ